MLVLFGILILIASIILGIIVLVQNPKGGGIAGALGGISNQLIGVKSSTDVMEKGTWIFAGVVALLCIVSPAFIPKDGTRNDKNDRLLQKTSTAPIQKITTTPDTATMPTGAGATKKTP